MVAPLRTTETSDKRTTEGMRQAYERFPAEQPGPS